MLGPSVQRSDKLRTWASRYVRMMVNRCNGNKRAASRALGISYHTLQGYLRIPLIDEPVAAVGHQQAPSEVFAEKRHDS